MQDGLTKFMLPHFPLTGAVRHLMRTVAPFLTSRMRHQDSVGRPFLHTTKSCWDPLEARAMRSLTMLSQGAKKQLAIWSFLMMYYSYYYGYPLVEEEKSSLIKNIENRTKELDSHLDCCGCDARSWELGYGFYDLWSVDPLNFYRDASLLDFECLHEEWRDAPPALNERIFIYRDGYRLADARALRPGTARRM